MSRIPSRDSLATRTRRRTCRAPARLVAPVAAATLVAAVGATPRTAAAATWSCTGGCVTSSAQLWNRLASAQDGDTICLAPGVYRNTTGVAQFTYAQYDHGSCEASSVRGTITASTTWGLRDVAGVTLVGNPAGACGNSSTTGYQRVADGAGRPGGVSPDAVVVLGGYQHHAFSIVDSTDVRIHNITIAANGNKMGNGLADAGLNVVDSTGRIAWSIITGNDATTGPYANPRLTGSGTPDVDLEGIALYGDATYFEVFHNYIRNSFHTGIMAWYGARALVAGNRILESGRIQHVEGVSQHHFKGHGITTYYSAAAEDHAPGSHLDPIAGCSQEGRMWIRAVDNVVEGNSGVGVYLRGNFQGGLSLVEPGGGALERCHPYLDGRSSANGACQLGASDPGWMGVIRNTVVDNGLGGILLGWNGDWTPHDHHQGEPDTSWVGAGRLLTINDNFTLANGVGFAGLAPPSGKRRRGIDRAPSPDFFQTPAQNYFDIAPGGEVRVRYNNSHDNPLGDYPWQTGDLVFASNHSGHDPSPYLDGFYRPGNHAYVRRPGSSTEKLGSYFKPDGALSSELRFDTFLFDAMDARYACVKDRLLGQGC